MRLAVFGFVVAVLAPAFALADQEACPTLAAAAPRPADCAAPAPAIGDAFSGPVLEVLDGQTVCVAEGPIPSQWVRVRLAGAAVSDTRADLMRAMFAKDVGCVAVARGSEAVTARCMTKSHASGTSLVDSRP